jgi:hypothetical protein
MPDQGLGGVRLLGGSGDACRVDDILLQLVRQSAYQLRAGLDYDIGSGDDRELRIASYDRSEDVRAAGHGPQFRLHLGSDAKTLEHALKMNAASTTLAEFERRGIPKSVFQ